MGRAVERAGGKAKRYRDYTNTTLRLGNISYRLGRTLQWGAAKEQVIGDAEANRLAIGIYREPWQPKGLLS